MSLPAAQARNFRHLVFGLCLTPLLSGITYVSYVKWKLRKSAHRAISPQDMYYIRNMKGIAPSIIHNPGIRIESNFLSNEEQSRLCLDCKSLIALYGYSVIPFYVRPNFNKQLSYLESKSRVNAIKVSGRPIDEYALPKRTDAAEEMRIEQEELLPKLHSYQKNDPTQAPWMFGHKFNEELLPSSIKELILKIRSLSEYAVGSVRDVTIDFRDDCYFRSDPYVYPGLDGLNMFLVTLSSDTVLTLTPPKANVHRRSIVNQVSDESFTDQDFDILHKRGDLLSLSGRARQELEWSVRQGIDANVKQLQAITAVKVKNVNEDENAMNEQKLDDVEYNSNIFVSGNSDILQNMNGDEESYVLSDWWGDKRHIVPRNKERVSIIITFSRAT